MENLPKEIARILLENRQGILDAWQQQLVVHARTLVAELGIGTVKQQTDRLLTSLIEALKEDAETDAARFFDTCELLNATLSKVDMSVLSHAELATFILALKGTIFNVLLGKGEAPKPECIQVVNAWFDHLMLHTFSMYLETREELIREQQRAFMEVSVPVVRLWRQIIMIPLVGMLDSSRTQQMMEAMLGALEEYQSKVAILDISGIPVVDTLVARHLITAASAARLMGAECIITGIRARISQTLVQLGVDLTGFVTCSTLADGLQMALKMTDQQIG